jgi:mono/diheme cytochrome c family protein
VKLTLIAGVAGVGLLITGALLGGANPNPTVTVPLYGAGLVQPAAAPGQSVEERLTRMEAKLDKLLKLIEDAAADVPAGDPTKAPPRANQAALVRGASACATCHHVNVAEQKGGGFRLFAPSGAFAALTPRQKVQLQKRLSTEDPAFRMPPPASGVKITDEERAALAAEFEVPK